MLKISMALDKNLLIRCFAWWITSLVFKGFIFNYVALRLNYSVPTGHTEKDGFIPKKNWDSEKVKHCRGFGWPDKKGSIWIPSGPNGHGGPHWDVQHPDGSYDNILPGGKIRGQKWIIKKIF